MARTVGLPTPYAAMYEPLDPMQLVMVYGAFSRSWAELVLKSSQQSAESPEREQWLSLAKDVCIELYAVLDILMERIRPISNHDDYIHYTRDIMCAIAESTRL